MPFGKESICGFDAVKRRGGPTIIILSSNYLLQSRTALLLKALLLLWKAPQPKIAAFVPYFLLFWI